MANISKNCRDPPIATRPTNRKDKPMGNRSTPCKSIVQLKIDRSIANRSNNCKHVGQLQLEWKLQRDRPIINKSANCKQIRKLNCNLISKFQSQIYKKKIAKRPDNSKETSQSQIDQQLANPSSNCNRQVNRKQIEQLQTYRPIATRSYRSAHLQTEQQIANQPNAKFIIEQNFIEKQTFKFLLSFQKYIAKINFLTCPIEKSYFFNILYFLYCTDCTCFRIS